jgi:hypothetical protein
MTLTIRKTICESTLKEEIRFLLSTVLIVVIPKYCSELDPALVSPFSYYVLYDTLDLAPKQGTPVQKYP